MFTCLPSIVVSTLLIIFYSLDCQVDRHHPGVEQIISLLKEKLYGIQSIQFNFTSFKEIDSDIKHLEAEFIMQGDNFVYSFISPIEKKKKYQIDIPKGEKPNNLLEMLSVKLHGGSRKTFDSLSNVNTVLTKDYYWNGKLYERLIFLVDNGVINDIYESPSIGGTISIYGDPRVLLGFYPNKYKDDDSYIPLSLYEFFVKEGSYYYKEENGFKILWHSTYLNPEYNYKSSCEVWFEKENKLVKIRTVGYPAREYPEDTAIIEKVIKKKATCDFPQTVINEVSFSNFYSKWQIPLQMEIIDYKLDCSGLFDIQQLFKDYESGKITQIEYKCYLCLCPRVISSKTTLLINEESLKINEPISEETFTPPIPTKPLLIKSETDTSTKNFFSHLSHIKYTVIIYTFLFLLIAIIIIFTIHRFFGLEI